MKIRFYEKPGCVNNRKQKALLEACGHEVETYSLLDEAWDADTLRSYFGTMPVSEWFNVAAPRIRSGEVDPGLHTEQTAIRAMLADTLLIRRPLIEAQGRRACGFDNALVNELIEYRDASQLQKCPNFLNRCN